MKNQILFLVASLTLLVSCADPTKEKFERAKKLNTISVYETFINENYASTYADSALIKLQGLELDQALTIEDLENFKRKYPQSIFLDSASVKIHKLRFQDVAIRKKFTANRVNELYAYLADHPKGYYAKSIAKTLDSLDSVTPPPPPPPPPAPVIIEVVEEDYDEEVVIETTERKGSLDNVLIPKNELANWVNNYGLQDLIEKGEDDHVIAQRRLGRYYAFVVKDYEEAEYWYEIAGEQLDYWALVSLGEYLANGTGGYQDKEQAATCFAYAEAVRDPAQYPVFPSLSEIVGHEKGKNMVMKVLVDDLIRSGNLFKATSNRQIIGNVYYNVAEFFEKGSASNYPKDLSKAIAFYRLAIDFGNKGAQTKVKELTN